MLVFNHVYRMVMFMSAAFTLFNSVFFLFVFDTVYYGVIIVIFNFIVFAFCFYISVKRLEAFLKVFLRYNKHLIIIILLFWKNTVLSCCIEVPKKTSLKENFAAVLSILYRITIRSDLLLIIMGFWRIVGWNYWTHVFSKDVEIISLAEIVSTWKLPVFVMILAQLWNK